MNLQLNLHAIRNMIHRRFFPAPARLSAKGYDITECVGQRTFSRVVCDSVTSCIFRAESSEWVVNKLTCSLSFVSYQASYRQCLLLDVKVNCGRNITLGYYSDLCKYSKGTVFWVYSSRMGLSLRINKQNTRNINFQKNTILPFSSKPKPFPAKEHDSIYSKWSKNLLKERTCNFIFSVVGSVTMNI